MAQSDAQAASMIRQRHGFSLTLYHEALSSCIMISSSYFHASSPSEYQLVQTRHLECVLL